MNKHFITCTKILNTLYQKCLQKLTLIISNANLQSENKLIHVYVTIQTVYVFLVDEVCVTGISGSAQPILSLALESIRTSGTRNLENPCLFIVSE